MFSSASTFGQAPVKPKEGLSGPPVRRMTLGARSEVLKTGRDALYSVLTVQTVTATRLLFHRGRSEFSTVSTIRTRALRCWLRRFFRGLLGSWRFFPGETF